MQSTATSVEDYLESLPSDRKEAMAALRDLMLKSVDKGFEETMQYGMITFVVPHSIYPDGYHCDPKQALPFIALASQKNYMSLYLFCIYIHPGQVDKFKEEYLATGKKLNMGASCVRFKKLDELPLDLISRTIRDMKLPEFVEHYKTMIPESKRKKK